MIKRLLFISLFMLPTPYCVTGDATSIKVDSPLTQDIADQYDGLASLFNEDNDSVGESDSDQEDDPKIKALIKRRIFTKPRIDKVVISSDLKNSTGSLVRNLDNNGYPTQAMISDIVEIFLGNKAGSFLVAKIGGGAHTGAIFRVTRIRDGRAIFLLKVGLPKESEASSLEAIQQRRVNLLEKMALHNNDFPNMTKVEKFFTYVDANNRTRIITVLHTAQGRDVFSYLREGNSSTVAECERIGTAVGKALGLFHRALLKNIVDHPKDWRGVIHGDFHESNVFVALKDPSSLPKIYPKKLRISDQLGQARFHTLNLSSQDVAARTKVFFIDNETINQSYKEAQPIDWDLIAFIFIPTLHFKWMHWLSESKGEWSRFLITVESFLKAYISVFPEDKKAVLSGYLYDVLDAWIKAAKKIITDASTKSIKPDNPTATANMFEYWDYVEQLFKNNCWKHEYPQGENYHKRFFIGPQEGTLHTFVKFINGDSSVWPRISKRLDELRAAIAKGK